MTLLTKPMTIGFLTILIFCLSACDSPVVETDSTASNKTDTHIVAKADAKIKDRFVENGKLPLWIIKGKQNTMYLVGSIHFMRADTYPLPTPFQTAFEDAEKLVFEIDEEIQDQATAQASVLKYAPLNNAKALKEAISAEQYSEIRKLAKENKVPMMMIDRFDPWYSSIMLSAALYMNAGLSPELGIDQHFMVRAQEANKPILGLETIDDQFSMFDSITFDLQVEMLVETLKESDDLEPLVNEMINEWKEGDMQGLSDLLMEDFQESDELYNKMLKQRNENWIPQLLPMLEDKDDYLVVVGAAHMLGEDGVLTLLEKEGYTAIQQ